MVSNIAETFVIFLSPSYFLFGFKHMVVVSVLDNFCHKANAGYCQIYLPYV